MKKRKSCNDVFFDAVLSDKNFCRKDLSKLVMKERKNRVKEVSQIILSRCIIDRNEYRKQGNDYLIGNEDVALNILDLINQVKKSLENRLKIDFETINDRALLPVEGDVDGNVVVIDEKRS